jgi:hypothetical protein
MIRTDPEHKARTRAVNYMTKGQAYMTWFREQLATESRERHWRDEHPEPGRCMRHDKQLRLLTKLKTSRPLWGCEKCFDEKVAFTYLLRCTWEDRHRKKITPFHGERVRRGVA